LDHVFRIGGCERAAGEILSGLERSAKSDRRCLRAVALILAVCAGAASASLRATCGPFTDAAADAFCPFVLEILTLGITTGTTPTTFDPTSDVTRVQMAAFLARTVDRTLLRGSGRRHWASSPRLRTGSPWA
jgi:hypothetical protein